MLQKILNLKGVVELSKKQQHKINGGECNDYCGGPGCRDFVECVTNADCGSFGLCSDGDRKSVV